MGSSGVSALHPTSNGGGGESPTPAIAYTDVFEKEFPFYLSIGMTYDQFWRDDVELVKFYREAWRLKQQVKEQELWLQGCYIYEAILDASPVLHSFAKKGTKPVPYRSKPYGLFENSAQKTREEQQYEDKKETMKVKAMLEAWAINVNKKFSQKGGEENGS